MKLLSISSVLLLVIIVFDQVNCQSPGFFRVRNTGAYFAKFRIVFMQNGMWTAYDSGDFAVSQSRTLDLPPGTSGYCELQIENLVFIGVWRTVVNLGFGSPVSKCFNVWGTTFNPGWGEEGC